MTSHSYSRSESTLLESYVLGASELPEPTITTNATSNYYDPGHTPTAAAAGATTAAITTAHLLSHIHLSSNTNPSPPSYQTIRYFLRPPTPIPPTSSPTITRPPTARADLHDLHQSLLRSHDLDLLLQEQPLVVLMLDERCVESIPIEEFLHGPYFPPEAGEHEPRARTVQSGYALQRFLNAGTGEEANVLYALGVGSWCQDIRHSKEEESEGE